MLADLAPLPQGISTTLDAFCRVHGLPEVRLWAQQDGNWVCLHPGDGTERSDWPSVRRAIDLPDGPVLELEIAGGNPREDDVDFLAHTIGQILSYEREARSAARELTERYEEINLLYFISEILASVLSVPDAAHWILSEVADVLGAKRASLWVYSQDDNQLHLAAAVGEEGVQGPISPDDQDSATALVFREKQPINLERGTALDRVHRLEPSPKGREAFLSVPINYTPPDGGTRTVGVITLVGRRSNVRFSAGDARLLAAIASQVGAALETQRLVQESLRQERLVRELELAHDLQLKLLPDAAKFGGPAQVAARCSPAESVGGDFYQLFRLSEDRVGVMIGDVSSHGFSAALIMALAMSAAAIYAQQSMPPSEVLLRVHQALSKELESTEMYLTLFYGVIDMREGKVSYSNAGHPHAFRVAENGSVHRLGATDLPLGMFAPGVYKEASDEWVSGKDLLVLFTDGLSDTFMNDGKTGEVALMDAIVKNRNRQPRTILDMLFSKSDRGNNAIPADDRSAVLIRG